MPAPNALATLDEVKLTLSLSGDDDDVKLSRLIDAASEYIERYCETAFVKRTFTELHRGGSKRIFLRKYPIVSVATIVDPAGNLIPPSDYIVLPEIGVLEHYGRFWIAQTTAGQPTMWSIAYVAGRFDGVKTVTDDVKLACAKMVNALRGLEIVPGAAQSVSLPGLAVSYQTGMGTVGSYSGTEAVPTAVKALLAKYRAGVVC